MKNIYVLILIAFFSMAVAQVAEATVGGPTYIYDFKFDSKTSSIYYTLQDYGGRGCPPMLYALSTTTNESKVIFGCENYDPKQAEKISTFTEGFDYLFPMNLKKNKISILINSVGVEKSEDDYVMRTNFLATVFQNGVKKTDVNISGCNADQHFVVDGYKVPGDQSKIVLIFSGKSSCFEGGYVGESVHTVSGFEAIDESIINTYKGNSALAPHEGSLVVYAGAPAVNESPKTLPATNDEQNNGGMYKYGLIVLGAILVFVGGIFLGRLGKKPSNSTVSSTGSTPPTPSTLQIPPTTPPVQ